MSLGYILDITTPLILKNTINMAYNFDISAFFVFSNAEVFQYMDITYSLLTYCLISQKSKYVSTNLLPTIYLYQRKVFLALYWRRLLSRSNDYAKFIQPVSSYYVTQSIHFHYRSHAQSPIFSHDTIDFLNVIVNFIRLQVFTVG